jgi:predicted enzyme related to lactoylglutathione lyase
MGFAVLGTSDLNRTIAFYRDVIGFPLVRMEPSENYAALDAGGIGLKLIGGHAPSPPPHPMLEIVVDDIDTACAELSARGASFTMPLTTMPWGARMAQITDPDGYLFYIMSGASSSACSP